MGGGGGCWRKQGGAMKYLTRANLDPERLHGARTSLVDCQPVGKVDNLVLCAMDDQDGGSHPGNLVNAERENTQSNKCQLSNVN